VDQVEVAIIGGGFVGTSAALYLAQRGVPVALFEKGVIAGEASGRSTGWIESQMQSPLKQEITELSRGLWRGMNALTGEETGYRPVRLVAFHQSDEEVEAARQWLESVMDLPNGGARLISAQEAATLMPGMAGQWKGALSSDGEGKAEPKLAAPAALGARKLGAKIYQNCAVRGLEMEGGRIAGVATEKGTVKARVVILAGGVWSPLFAGSIGLDLPQVAAYATMSSIEPVANGPEISAILPGALLRREIDGGYTGAQPDAVGPITPDTIKRFFSLLPALQAMGSMVDPTLSLSGFWRDLRTPSRWPLDEESPFERIRIFEPEIHPDRAPNGWAVIKAAHPAFADIKIRDQWAGSLMTTLDNMPVISEVEQAPGLLIGSGLYYGLTWGPAAGSLLADLATGTTPAIDIRNFRFSRFHDGSKLEFQA
jgi:glycine/D-amino acid oxidase-like deaminating enzyme